MQNLANVVAPVVNSSFGQLVINSGRVTASTATRAAAMLAVGILFQDAAVAVTRTLRAAPFGVGRVCEYINPALVVSKANSMVTEKSEQLSLWVLKKFNLVNDDLTQKTVAKFRNESHQVIVSKLSNTLTLGDDAAVQKANQIGRVLMLQSYMKVAATLVAGLAVLPTLQLAEKVSPGLDTWQAVLGAVRVPVKITL